jgi:hypothetical protein
MMAKLTKKAAPHVWKGDKRAYTSPLATTGTTSKAFRCGMGSLDPNAFAGLFQVYADGEWYRSSSWDWGFGSSK